jgi:hypothetical protein
MLAFLALGVLDKTNAFPEDDVSEELLSKISIKKPIVKNDYTVRDDYLELIPPLAEKGRHDLVRIIKRKLARRPGWKKRIKQFDGKYLNGNLVRFKRSVFS